jgi:hypothetical protein
VSEWLDDALVNITIRWGRIPQTSRMDFDEFLERVGATFDQAELNVKEARDTAPNPNSGRFWSELKRDRANDERLERAR